MVQKKQMFCFILFYCSIYFIVAYTYTVSASDRCVVWCAAELTIIDAAVDQWREHIRCCVKANSRHFKHLL